MSEKESIPTIKDITKALNKVAQQLNKITEVQKEYDRQRKADEQRRKEEEAQRRKEEAQRRKEEAQRRKEEAQRRKEEEQRRKEEDQRRKEKDEKNQKEFAELARGRRTLEKAVRKAFRQMGKWGLTLGEIVESVVYANLQDILNKRNMGITKVIKGVGSKSNDHPEENFEFDFIAINKDSIVVVEAKSYLEVSDVKHFLKQLRNIIKWCPQYKDLKVYGGVAYLRGEDRAFEVAKKYGLFVIHAVGESAKIDNPGDFKPKKIPQNQ